MSEEMKELILLIANVVAEMEEKRAAALNATSNVTDEIRRLADIIRARGG